MITQNEQRLILAAEIAGYLHDLGKLHPGFADEKLVPKNDLRWPEDNNRPSTGISEPHGRICEDGRVYPSASELEENNGILRTILDSLKNDHGWKEVLALPSEWIKKGTIQASGLADPLRQHHAGNKFPSAQSSFLGDLYAMGADIRDSALDKGSGGTSEGPQHVLRAEIADAFGWQRSGYSPAILDDVWKKVVTTLIEVVGTNDATVDIVATRNAVLQRLKPLFELALGETRRPTNDVTLSYHAYSTASFFKACVAEGVLRKSFLNWQTDSGTFDLAQLGRVRFRLLGVRWDWCNLTRGMLSPVALVSLSVRRREVVENLRLLLEEKAAIGNVIYEDDDGILLLAPGFHEVDAKLSEALFAQHVLDPMAISIVKAIEPFGSGAPFRLCWSEPTLYLTDYTQALGLDSQSPLQRHLQAGEMELRAQWAAANLQRNRLIQVCPQCGMRPAEAREYAHTESSIRDQMLCDECTSLTDRYAKSERWDEVERIFGFVPKSFNLEDLAKSSNSSRIALLSVRVASGEISSGTALVTQLARPLSLLKENEKKFAGVGTANDLGNWFEKVLQDLRAGKDIDDPRVEAARELIGDRYWLWLKKKTKPYSDGRGSPLDIAKEFFLRESAGLPPELGLVRHDGDRLALFAMRKHASPSRLQRTWDELRDLWRSLAAELSGELGGRVIPLTLDARGICLMIAANDADDAVQRIQEKLTQSFSKLRGGLSAHVSCVVMRPKFPLYLALDALERMERRIAIMPRQTWQLTYKRLQSDNRIHLAWKTTQGVVNWIVDTSTGDAQQRDRWHPHFIVARRNGKDITGPDRIVHVDDMLIGDEALIPPMTFDFMALEGSARRHQIVWKHEGEELHRPHWVMGDAGRTPLLLENFEAFSRLVSDTGWDTSKVKGLQGEMVETYEKWVRDVPATMRETGRTAWHAHLRNMLRRYVSDIEVQERLFSAVIDGRFFDAIEWTTFVSKSSKIAITTETNP
jgi:hypothetical protein